MQAAIIKIDNNTQLVAYNDAAKALFSSNLLSLDQPFDYRNAFNLDTTFDLSEHDDTIIVLNSQYFLLQKINESSLITFVLQPVEYLKKR